MAPILRTRLKNISGLQNLFNNKPFTISKKRVLIQKKQMTKVQQNEKLKKKREAKRLRPNTIIFNSLSCLDCQPGIICEHLSMGQINYSDNRLSLPSAKIQKVLKKSQKDPVVRIEFKKPKVIPNVTFRRSLRNKE